MEIHHLTEISQFAQVLRLQRDIWQMSDLEIQPTDTFVIAEKTGGATFGAFEDGHMVGFSFGLPAIKDDGTPYLHSHMLGVLPAYSNRGIGRALKLTQRDWAMSRRLHLIEWTFDPLQVKNAFFNIERLGAIVRRTYRNLYGGTSNALDAGLPTDRCVAEWLLHSDRVKRVVDDGLAIYVSPLYRVQVPANTHLLRHTNPDAVRRWQQEIMDGLSQYFSEGLALIGVERKAESASYLIGKPPV